MEIMPLWLRVLRTKRKNAAASWLPRFIIRHTS